MNSCKSTMVSAQLPQARCRAAGATVRVFAETATLLRVYPSRPCVLLSQGDRDRKVGVALVTIEGVLIRRIDMCTVLPTVADARGSGSYPE